MSTNQSELDKILICNCGMNDILNGKHYDDCPKALKPAIENWNAQEGNKAVLAELQSLYDYATNGTRVKTLVGNRIAQLTALIEQKLKEPAPHQGGKAE